MVLTSAFRDCQCLITVPAVTRQLILNIRTATAMIVRPFAIDGNGKQVSHEVINAVLKFNKSDSSVAFAEKQSVDATLRKTYILVWSNYGGVAKPGGDFMGQGEYCWFHVLGVSAS